MRKADECGPPGRCMMLPGCLRLATFSLTPCFGHLPAPGKLALIPIHPNPPVPKQPVPHTDTSFWRPPPDAPVSHSAMEQSGHAQEPTLLVALVWRQAGRAGWTLEICCKNIEECKFKKERRYQFEGFAFQNILKGRLYFFLRQYGVFMNTREHKNATTL